MELKVGDKVRSINEATGVPIGTRGTIRIRRDEIVTVEWSGGGGNQLVLERADEYFIKEFQPGDRVVFTPDGNLGTFAAYINDHVFTVLWDGRSNTHEYTYRGNVVAHAPTASNTIHAPPPTIPPPPPVPSHPERTDTGRCYFCGERNSEWLKDRFTCDVCMERFR